MTVEDLLNVPVLRLLEPHLQQKLTFSCKTVKLEILCEQNCSWYQQNTQQFTIVIITSYDSSGGGSNDSSLTDKQTHRQTNTHDTGSIRAVGELLKSITYNYKHNRGRPTLTGNLFRQWIVIS